VNLNYVKIRDQTRNNSLITANSAFGWIPPKSEKRITCTTKRDFSINNLSFNRQYQSKKNIEDIKQVFMTEEMNSIEESQIPSTRSNVIPLQKEDVKRMNQE